jgi:molybdenum cofactor cytidylyltransferase
VPTPCNPVAAVILAAGAATRMGQLKQLLPYRGVTLIEHCIHEVRAAGFDPVIVVVGAEAGAVRERIAKYPVEIVENEAWASGMGTSVMAGVQALVRVGAESAGVALLLADQPLVTSAHLAAMRTALIQTNATVIAAEYNGTLGVPALFKRIMLPQLTALRAETGARGLLRSPGIDVTAFPLPEAASDIDTPEDFAALLR